MKLIIAIILLGFLVGCDKKTEYCRAYRLDLSRDFECSKGNDTFYFHVWLNPEPIDSDYPKEILDSITKIQNKGYIMKRLNSLVIENTTCSECQKILKLNVNNSCKSL